jgi:hypothetical protein
MQWCGLVWFGLVWFGLVLVWFGLVLVWSGMSVEMFETVIVELWNCGIVVCWF